MENVDAVIKIGGSIIKRKERLRNVCREVNRLARKGYKIIIVPGGGEIVEYIRKIYKEYKFSDDIAHWMAIKAMDINGLFISVLSKDFSVVTTVKSCIRELKKRHIPIFLTSRFLKKHDDLPKSWDVTSDSISLYLAQILKARHNILLKDVDGIYRDLGQKNIIEKIKTAELKALKRGTCVDKYLPKLLLKYRRNSHIISGLHPERIEQVLVKKMSIGTLIVT